VRKKRPVLPLVLAVILAVGMFQPMPTAAANLYFTGIKHPSSAAELRSCRKIIFFNSTPSVGKSQGGKKGE
jgi:hypothetical protein